MVQPLRDEVVQQFGVDQVSVVHVKTPEGEHHKLQEVRRRHTVSKRCSGTADAQCLNPISGRETEENISQINYDLLLS